MSYEGHERTANRQFLYASTLLPPLIYPFATISGRAYASNWHARCSIFHKRSSRTGTDVALGLSQQMGGQSSSRWRPQMTKLVTAKPGRVYLSAPKSSFQSTFNYRQLLPSFLPHRGHRSLACLTKSFVIASIVSLEDDRKLDDARLIYVQGRLSEKQPAETTETYFSPQHNFFDAATSLHTILKMRKPRLDGDRPL